MLQKLISKEKAIEETIQNLKKQSQVAEGKINIARASLLMTDSETKQPNVIADDPMHKIHVPGVADQNPNATIPEVLAPFKGHTTDPLKQYLKKKSRATETTNSSEKTAKTTAKTKLSLLQDSFPSIALDDSGIDDKLTYKAADASKECLIQIVRNRDTAGDEQDTSSNKIKKAQNACRHISSKEQGLQFLGVEDISLPACKSNKILNEHLIEIMLMALNEFIKAKDLMMKGGSRKSGRTRAEMTTERLTHGERALNMYHELQSMVQFFTISTCGFVYQNTMSKYLSRYYTRYKYPNENLSMLEQKEKIINLIKKGLMGQEIIEELCSSLDAYCAEVDQYFNYEHQLRKDSTLNDWMDKQDISSVSFNGCDDVKSLANRIYLQRKTIDSEENSSDTINAQIEAREKRKERLKDQLENLPRERHLAQHEKIQNLEREITDMKQLLKDNEYKLMELEMELFQSSLSTWLRQILPTVADRTNIDAHSNLFEFLSWMNPITSEQVARIIFT